MRPRHRPARASRRGPLTPGGRLIAAALFLLVVGATGKAVADTQPGEPVAQDPLASATLELPSQDERSPGRPFAALPWGEGEGEVGLAGAQEGLTRGPEALGVDTRGRVTVLDSVNHRLLLLDSEGRMSAAAPLPLREPRWLAVEDEALYVLDSDADRRLVALDRTGALLFERDVPLPEEPVTAFFARQGRIFVEVLHEAVFELLPDGKAAFILREQRGRPADARGAGRIQVTMRPGGPLLLQTAESAEASVRETRVDMPRPVEQVLSLDADRQGRVALGFLAEGDEDILLARLPVAREPVHTLRLENRAGKIHLGPLYHLGADGHVYQPEASEEGYVIRVHEFDGAGGRR
jgi:hypothetical protein